MKRFVYAFVICALLVASAGADITVLPGLIRAPMSVRIDLPDGRRIALEALAIRPDRPGRFPLVVLVHGTPRGEGKAFLEKIAQMSPALLSAPAIAFATHGYAVVSIMRRGFGRSEGPFAESPSGPCDNRDYLNVGRTSAEDVSGAVAALRREPWVDPDRVILLGYSTGGFAVTAAASSNPPGVMGVLNFAGGRGSAAPDQTCSGDRLVEAFGIFGQTARIPALWIYAENDHYIASTLARRLLDAYTGAGAPAQLQMLLAYGADGHLFLMSAPQELLWPQVEAFLAMLHLPVALVVALPPLPEIAMPSGANATCEAGFRAYVAARTDAKAFAVNPNGHCGWNLTADTLEQAKLEAMKLCTSRWKDCRPYAAGQQLEEAAN